MTAEASSARPTPAEDEALIADIAPPMLEKLKSDGLTKGTVLGSSLVMASLAVTLLMHDSDFADSSAVAYSAIAIAVVALAVLPFALKKLSVSAELRYRRRHGKWRWER